MVLDMELIVPVNMHLAILRVVMGTWGQDLGF